MPTRQAVYTNKAPAPLPVYSQAIVCNRMVYCSGQVAINPETNAMAGGGISDRTVCHHLWAGLRGGGRADDEADAMPQELTSCA